MITPHHLCFVPDKLIALSEKGSLLSFENLLIVDPNIPQNILLEKDVPLEIYFKIKSLYFKVL